MVDVIVIGDFCGLEEVEAGVDVVDIGGLLVRCCKLLALVLALAY